MCVNLTAVNIWETHPMFHSDPVSWTSSDRCSVSKCKPNQENIQSIRVGDHRLTRDDWLFATGRQDTPGTHKSRPEVIFGLQRREEVSTWWQSRALLSCGFIIGAIYWLHTDHCSHSQFPGTDPQLFHLASGASRSNQRGAFKLRLES